MINILPSELKEQIAYSRRNKSLIRYIRLLAALIIINGGIFAATWWSLSSRATSAERDKADAARSIAHYQDVATKAKEVSARLSAAKTIQANQSRFSALLSDLGKYTPKGVFINAITLTGDDKKPVQISATASSYNGAAAFRDSLANSPRISGADIMDINNPTAGVYKVNLTIGFNPGKSR